MDKILLDFDFSVLDDPEFKEDSVREVIIAPMLKALGYLESNPHKITRSKRLKHPFVYIGTKKEKITIIPDYILSIDDKCVVVLDAKSPQINITKNKYEQQIYSYAIHPEVRARYYGLCNGMSLVIFETGKITPVIDVRVCALKNKKAWKSVYDVLSVQTLKQPSKAEFFPDYGVHLLKSGYKKSVEIYFYDVPIYHIIRANDDLFTFMNNFTENEITYAISFDMLYIQYVKLLKSMGSEQATQLNSNLTRQPYKAEISPPIRVSLGAQLGCQVSNKDETFIPLIINSIDIVH